MKVEIEKLDHYGRGITKINEKICFVENALPEEIVEIEADEIHKYSGEYILLPITGYFDNMVTNRFFPLSEKFF